MSTSWKRLLFALAAVAVASGLVFAFVEGREEIAREREREKPIQVPPRVSQGVAGEVVVEVDRETRERISLATAPLVEGAEPDVTPAFGGALDPNPFLSLHAELSTAEAALAASCAEFERTRALHREGENASAKSLEAATAQLRADESRVRLAQRQLAQSWGEDVAALASADRETLAEKLASNARVAVGASLPLGETLRAQPRAASVLLLGAEDRPLHAAAVHEVLTIEQSAQGRTFLVWVEPGEIPLRPGAPATVLLEAPGGLRAGAVVPREGVVRTAGGAWAYVQLDDDRFARRRVVTDHPTADGWFVSTGLRPGERVVVSGAQTLLSEEQKTQIEVGEEAEE